MATDSAQRLASRRWILTSIQAGVTIACLFWLGQKPEIREGLSGAIASASPLWLFYGVLIAGIVVALGVIRWQVFLRLQGIHISWSENAKLTLIGSFFNLVLLGTVGGDAVKILYLMRRFPKKKSAALVSILMDHLCGLPVVILFYATFVLSRWDWLAPSGLSTQLALFAGIYLGVSLIGILLLLLTATFRGETTPSSLPKLWPFFPSTGRSRFLAWCFHFPFMASTSPPFMPRPGHCRPTLASSISSRSCRSLTSSPPFPSRSPA